LPVTPEEQEVRDYEEQQVIQEEIENPTPETNIPSENWTHHHLRRHFFKNSQLDFSAGF